GRLEIQDSKQVVSDLMLNAEVDVAALSTAVGNAVKNLEQLQEGEMQVQGEDQQLAVSAALGSLQTLDDMLEPLSNVMDLSEAQRDELSDKIAEAQQMVEALSEGLNE